MNYGDTRYATVIPPDPPPKEFSMKNLLKDLIIDQIKGLLFENLIGGQK